MYLADVQPYAFALPFGLDGTLPDLEGRGCEAGNDQDWMLGREALDGSCLTDSTRASTALDESDVELRDVDERVLGIGRGAEGSRNGRRASNAMQVLEELQQRHHIVVAPSNVGGPGGIEVEFIQEPIGGLGAREGAALGIDSLDIEREAHHELLELLCVVQRTLYQSTGRGGGGRIGGAERVHGLLGVLELSNRRITYTDDPTAIQQQLRDCH